MEGVSDGAVTGPALHPPPGCVCVSTGEHASVVMHILFVILRQMNGTWMVLVPIAHQDGAV